MSLGVSSASFAQIPFHPKIISKKLIDTKLVQYDYFMQDKKMIIEVKALCFLLFRCK